MAGFNKLYVIGEQGGFMGADGVNPIEFMLLVGDAGRQWIEPLYVDVSIKPLGALKNIVPEGPDFPDSILDACLAFAPAYFGQCPSLKAVRKELNAMDDMEQLDFDQGQHRLPASWATLREEARPLFWQMNVWRADFVPLFQPARMPSVGTTGSAT